MIFLVKCPRCKKNMKYHTNTTVLAQKRKKCVYCGRSFQVKDNIIKRAAKF